MNKEHPEYKRVGEKLADTVEVECPTCPYHNNYPTNCYIEPITTPFCRHRYELVDHILSLIQSHLKLLGDEEIKDALFKVQPEGFDWVDMTDAERVKYGAISQATIDKIKGELGG